MTVHVKWVKKNFNFQFGLSSVLYDEFVTITNNSQLKTVNVAEGRDSNMKILRPRGRESRIIDLHGYIEAAGSLESETLRLLHN